MLAGGALYVGIQAFGISFAEGMSIGQTQYDRLKFPRSKPYIRQGPSIR